MTKKFSLHYNQIFDRKTGRGTDERGEGDGSKGGEGIKKIQTNPNQKERNQKETSYIDRSF